MIDKDSSTIYLDLATVTGVCTGEPKNYQASLLDLGIKKTLAERLNEFDKWLYLTIKDRQYIRVVVEKAFTRGKHDAPVLYGLHAILKLFCYRDNIYLVEIEPSKLKKWLTGKGNAGKQSMLESLYTKFGIVEHDHNKGDAIALMLYDCKHNSKSM